jgi:hypothetical protein
LDYYRNASILVDIDGSKSPEDVFAAVVEFLAPWST